MDQVRQSESQHQAQAGEARQHYVAGAKLLRQRNVDAALQELAKAIRLQPVFPEALQALGLAFKAKGQLDKSAKYLNAASLAWARRNNPQKAAELYRICCKFGLQAENPYKTLAAAMHKKGQAVKSCSFYEKALELSPEDQALATAFAKALVQAGRASQARRFLNSYLQKYPESEELQRLHSKLGATAKEIPASGNVPSKATRSSQVLTDVLNGAQAHDEDGFEMEVEGSYVSVSKPPDPPVQKIVEQQKQDCREKRRSPRIPLADYFLRFPKRREHQLVVDISREGVGFKVGDMPLRRGQKLQFDLMVFEKVKIKKLQAVVRHVTHGMAGCEFMELSRKQQKLLDTLILSTNPVPTNKDVNAPMTGKEETCFDLDMW